MSRGFASMDPERLHEITAAAGRKSAERRYGKKIGTFRYAQYYNRCPKKKKCHCHNTKGHGPYWIISKYHNGRTYTLQVGKDKPTDWTPFEEKLMQKIAASEGNHAI